MINNDFKIFGQGDRTVVVTRSFAAPPDRVARAFLKADLARQWLGSPEMPLTICEIDARQGGSFRYGWQMPNGTTMLLSGTFTEIAESRVVHTETFDPDWTAGETTVNTLFIARGTFTEVRTEVVYASTSTRDMMLTSGMGAGMARGYNRLDTML